MADLIERQDVLDEMQICDFVRIENFAGDVRMLFEDDLEKRINAIPSAETEIVHCKDCKYYICHDDDELPDYLPEWFCHHPELYQGDDYDFAALAMSPSDFCSKGERKDG